LLGLVAVNLTAVTTVLLVLFVTRLLEGLSTSCSTPSLLGYLSARTEGDAMLRGRVMSWFEVGTAMGMALGAVTGSLLWGALGRPAFVAVGGIYLLSAGLFWLVRDADFQRRRDGGKGGRGEGRSMVESFRRVLRYRTALRFAPAWLAVNAIVGLWLNHAIYQMTEGHSAVGQYLVGALGTGELAAVLGGYTVAFGAGGLAWGSFIGKLGERFVMRVTLVGMIGAGAMIGVMNHSGGPGPLLGLGVAGFVVTVLLESGFAPAAVSYLARLSAELAEDRGLFMGLYSVVLGLGQIVGSWLGGPFADRWAMDGVLMLTFILGAAAVWFTWTLPGGESAQPETA
jgi:MFS family permease